MTWYGEELPAFRAGLRASTRAEFRHSDVHGRPIDPAAETETARAERIRMLQDRRTADGPRSAPATSPAGILAELITRDPQSRMSRFAAHLAEFPELMPRGGRAPARPAADPGRPGPGDGGGERGRGEPGMDRVRPRVGFTLPGQEPEREPDALAQGEGPAPRRPRVRRAGHGQRAADAAQGPGGPHPRRGRLAPDALGERPGLRPGRRQPLPGVRDRAARVRAVPVAVLHPVRPARHRVRTLDGAAAWDQLERRAWLDLMEAAGWVVEIEHRNRPS